MDNAGENKKLESRLKSVAWKSPVVIEYATRDTPQQNSPVEVGFYALVNKSHATIHHANLPMKMQYQLFREIFITVTLLDSLTVIESYGKHVSCYDWLSFPSVGSPKHKVLQVGLLKGHVQLKELSISPVGGIRLERSSLSLSTRVVGALDVSKTCSTGSGGYGKVTGLGW